MPPGSLRRHAVAWAGLLLSAGRSTPVVWFRLILLGAGGGWDCEAVVICANPACSALYEMMACLRGSRNHGRSSRPADRHHIFILRRKGCSRDNMNDFEAAEFGACQDAIQ